MINQEIVGYIRAELAKGVNKEQIMNALIKVGWGIKDVQDSFENASLPDPAVEAASEAANILITEKDYPITTLWVYKAPVFIFLLAFISLLSGEIDLFWLFAGVITVVVNYLTRANFHYSTEGKFFLIREGIISKAQRNLPYGVIQNVFVKQDVFDRVFGLASLAIENASLGGKAAFEGNRNQRSEAVGSSGNKVNIPGLRREDAEALKNVILQRMKENPIEDSQSGL